jgi:transposase
MDHFAGLDVSVKETSICIVDDAGKIVREVKVASEPEALLAVLKNLAYHFKRIGLEAGPLSQWLFSALAEAGLPVICVETRHMQAVLKAQINKTDRNDARGIAQMMRAGLYRPVHVKTIRSQKLRMLLTHRKLLQSKAIAIENDLRGTLRNFGLKVGMVGKVKFEARIRELVENLPDLAVLVEPMLIVRRVLREQIVILHRRLLAIVRDDEVCRRLMTTPGVGPVVALTYRATVDVPARFRKSNVLPPPIADELKRKGRVQPKYTRSATILFADFQDFTLLAERTEPATLVGLLDQYFTVFDGIVARHGLEKLKTIGDAYMAVGGVPEADRRHPIDACLAALEMQATVARIKSRNEKMLLRRWSCESESTLGRSFPASSATGDSVSISGATR